MSEETAEPFGDGAQGERRAFWTLAAFSALALLPGVSHPSQITRGDVYRFYVRQVMGMVEDGSWLLPKVDDIVWLTKPPLVMWAMKLGFLALPGSLVGLRLPFLLSSLACVLLTYRIGRFIKLDRTRSALGALLFLTCSAMGAYGRQPLMEAPLTLTLMASFHFLVVACESGDTRWLYASGLAVGVSSMVKWAVGPLTFGLFAFAYLAASGRWRFLLAHKKETAAAALLPILIPLPWNVYACLKMGHAYWHQVKIEVFSERFKGVTTVSDFVGHGLLAGLAPWTLLVLAAGARLKRLDRLQASVLGAWAFGVLLPCFMITARTSRYSFPSLPAFCLVAAALVEPEDKLWKAALRATAVLLGLIFVIAFGACGWMGLLGPTLLAAGLASGLGAAFWCWKGDTLRGAAACALCLALLLGPAFEALGMNVLPERLAGEIGTRKVARFQDNPEAAGTGYVTLILRRMIYIYDARQWDLGLIDPKDLFVVSGSGYGVLQEKAAKLGLVPKTLDTWRSPNTNPKGPAIKEALRARSLEPIQVDHYLVELVQK